MGILETAKAYVMAWAPRLALALAVLIVGFWLVKRLANFIDARLADSDVDPTLRPFLRSIISIGLKVLIIISVASMVGIATTSFVAVVGAMGLAVGLALQGSLANFAGGVLILLFRPFQVGDVIEAQGYIGSVTGIQIFNTILRTGDNKTIIIPNGKLSNDSLTNYSTESTRRQDFTFGVGYNDDIDKVKGILEGIIAADERVLADPEPMVAVSELAGSSVNFLVRVWTKAEDTWPLHWELFETVKKALDAEGISIPYPQMDVHLDK